MSSYKELQVQITELHKMAKQAKSQEMAGALTQIKELMQQFGITAADLEGSGKEKAKGKPAAVAFRDGDKTWSGRGRSPSWLAGKDKEQFRVKA